MKIIAYTALLYGKDYLAYAIHSVIDHVDEYHVIFDVNGHGSHGHYTSVPCPDTRAELYAQAESAAGSKLRWHDAGPFRHEGEQRESILQFASDADVILVLDSDEIWPEGLVSAALSTVTGDPYQARGWRLPIIHFWRSFHKAVLHDPAFPTRIILPKFPSGDRTIAPWPYMPICHMGYAQRSEIVCFKLETHGHKGEFRRDCDWFRDVFMANRLTDCHPVGSEYWNPEEVNPWQYMPGLMRSHPYAELEIIP